MESWLDYGIKFKIELATTGDLVAGNVVRDYPFDSSSGGVATGWTKYVSTGVATDVNWTVLAGNQSISNALGTSSIAVYGIDRIFPYYELGKQYRLDVKARTIDNRSPSLVQMTLFRSRDGASLGGWSVGNKATVADWEGFTVTSPVMTDVNANGIGVRLTAMRNGSDINPNWGGQFTGVSITSIDPSGGPPIEWRDITCDVKSVNIRHGRERYTSRYEVGTFSLVLANDKGLYAYREIHDFGLRPGRQIRLSAVYQGITYPMAYGVLDSIVDGYSLDGRAIATMTAFDVTTVTSNINSPNLNLFALDTHGARINVLLDAVGYTPRQVDAGVFRTTDVQASGRTIRDEMGVTADSEGGSVFGDREGRIVFKDRTWLATDPKLSNVTANITAIHAHANELPPVDDIPDLPDAPVLCPFSLVPDWSLARVVNFVSLANAGGTAQTFVDVPSQKAHGVHTYQRMDFVNRESSVLATRANDIMAGNADPKLRVNNTALRPMANDMDAWPWLLSVFLNWAVRVWYIHPLNDWGFAVVTHVQSIEHRITTSDWESTFTLDQPMAFTTFEFSERGWDVAEWDTDEWDA